MIMITNPHFSQYRVSRDSLPTQSSNLASRYIISEVSHSYVLKTRMLLQQLIQLILHLAWTDRIMFLLMSSIEINEHIIEHLHDLWGPDFIDAFVRWANRIKFIIITSDILLTSSNNQISEFWIPNIYNAIFVLIFLMILRTNFEASLRFRKN